MIRGSVAKIEASGTKIGGSWVKNGGSGAKIGNSGIKIEALRQRSGPCKFELCGHKWGLCC